MLSASRGSFRSSHHLLEVCNPAVVQVAHPRFSNLLHRILKTLVETEKEKPAKEPVEQLLAKQEPGGVVQRTDSGTLNSPRPSWWWVELWSAKRPLVKEGVAHGLSFAGVVVFLEGAHRLLKWSSLPPEELYVFTKVHFYMFAIILVVFALGLIIKVLNSELLGKAYEAKNH